MKSWRAPEVPNLPGTGRVPYLIDRATGASTLSATGDTARMYVCGITPYDATHIGHSATYVAFDLLLRAWRDAGVHVAYVQNVTDVDDPLLERANQNGEDWRELAERQVELFRADMAAMRVIPPQHFVGAVEAMPLISETVRELVARGVTYDLDGDVYYQVGTDPLFGKVSGWTEEQMLEVYADRGGDPDRTGKRDRLDALVWLARRPDEPYWDGGTLGPGRPGWHIECTAIALDRLGMPIDVQAGGSDLVFPHHEMGASQAHALRGEAPFARAFAYQGMVGLDGEKMSKSKGNLVFSSQLRAQGTDPMAIRLVVLSQHYRSDWEWTDRALREAERRLDRWRAAATRRAGPSAVGVLEGIRQALADDLDAPTALAVMDAWVEATLAGEGTDEQAPQLVADTCDALLGVTLRP